MSSNDSNQNKIPKTYRLSIETILLLDKVRKIEKRDRTNFLENAIQEKANFYKVSVSQEEIEQVIQEIEQSKLNKAKKKK